MEHRSTRSRGADSGRSHRRSPHLTTTTIAGQNEATGLTPIGRSLRPSGYPAKRGPIRAVKQPILSTGEKTVGRGRTARATAKAVALIILAGQVVSAAVGLMPRERTRLRRAATTLKVGHKATRSRPATTRSGPRGRTPGREGRHLTRQRPPKLIWSCAGRTRAARHTLSCYVTDVLRRL